MSAETHHYYGFSLTEKFDAVRKAMAEVTGTPVRFDLARYVQNNKIGESHYDGGGWGQVTYIGRDVPMSERGIYVTDELEAEVRKLIADLPGDFKSALAKVFGKVPEPKFNYEESYG